MHLLGLPRNTEAYHVTTFQVVREDKQGNSHLVTVEVLDAGDGQEHSRYMAVARSDNGKAASGSAASKRGGGPIDTPLVTNSISPGPSS